MKEDTLQPMPQDFKKIIRYNHQELYINKLNNLDRVDKFLETHNLPILNQEEIESLNGPITNKEIESIINTSRQRKTQNEMASQDLYQAFIEELMPILHKLF